MAAGAAASASFKVTAPDSGLSPGLTGLLATATFSAAGPGGGTQTLINSANVTVPVPSLASTFDNTGITDNSNLSPSPSSSR